MQGVDFRRREADRGAVARGTSLRHLRPARFRRSRNRATVELLTVRIAGLVSERQTLRTDGAAFPALERNRLQIARAQWELAHALIDRHLPAADARTAA